MKHRKRKILLNQEDQTRKNKSNYNSAVGVALTIQTEKEMTKEELIEILKRVLQTDADLGFLSKLDKAELESLVATIRDRVESAN